MSLNKFLNIKSTPKVEEKKPIKKIEEPIESKEDSKHHLKCSNPKCQYMRTMNKKVLSEADYICRKCKSPMKAYKPRKKTSSENTEDIDEEN